MIAFANTSRDPLRRFAQHVVATQMTEPVVYVLEIIQVYKQHGKRMAGVASLA
jgi:hypothetical protein